MGAKAGILYRVSSSGQDEENQVPKLTAWCRDHDYEVARTYRLHAKSAYHGEQAKTLAQIIEDVAHHKISVLVVVRVDRIERRKNAARHVFNFIGNVRDWGGRVEFVEQQYLNIEGPGSDVMLANLASMAHEESRIKEERTRDGIQHAKRDGGLTIRPPWGYAVRGQKFAKHWVATEDGEFYIPQIFIRVAGGESLASVKRWLQSEDIEDKTWSVSGLAGMIRNHAYTGRVRDAQGNPLGKCPELVKMDVFNRANKALSEASRKHRGRTTTAMLSGALTCSCGSPAYRTQRKGRTEEQHYSYYRCEGCRNTWTADKLERAVEEIADKHFAHPVFTEVWIPGVSYEADRETVEEDLLELPRLRLPREEEDARRIALRAEQDRLAALEDIPGEWHEEVDPLHLDYRLWWQEIPRDQRGRWLAEQGFAVVASKTSIAVKMWWNDDPVEMELT